MNLLVWTVLLSGLDLDIPREAERKSIVVEARSPAELDRLERELTPTLQTGTLLFSRGKSLTVKVISGSSYTHVAAVVVDQAGVNVYDAMRKVGVRCLSLRNHLISQEGDQIEVCQPRHRLSDEQAIVFRATLTRQIGRPYAVFHHITGYRCDGVHCSEYVTDALSEAQIVTAERPPRVTPASLRDSVLGYELYSAETTVRYSAPIEPDSGSFLTRWRSSMGCGSK